MFRIGEFSKIAQVSGRLLRYYDEIGLLQPEHIDNQTGYRFYRARQLPRLNRILALKGLGLSLDQISRLLDEDISPEEIRGMLLMKRAQVEQALHEEMQRFRAIESRLEQIESDGNIEPYDLIIKSVPSYRFLALRKTCNSLEEARDLVYSMQRVLPVKVGTKALGQFAIIVHSETFEWNEWDIEMGFYLETDVPQAIQLADGHEMTVRELPGCEPMATAVRMGGIDKSAACYGSLGTWIEEQGYRLVGPGREVFIQLPPASGAGRRSCRRDSVSGGTGCFSPTILVVVVFIRKDFCHDENRNGCRDQCTERTGVGNSGEFGASGELSSLCD